MGALENEATRRRLELSNVPLQNSIISSKFKKYFTYGVIKVTLYDDSRYIMNKSNFGVEKFCMRRGARQSVVLAPFLFEVGKCWKILKSSFERAHFKIYFVYTPHDATVCVTDKIF